MSSNRNEKLIRNLIGNKVDHHVVDLVEKAYSKGISFPELATCLFVIAASNPKRVVDVAFWIARVLPDDSVVFAESLMTECREVAKRNPKYVHVMMTCLFQIAVALDTIPSHSTEDDRDFRNKFPTWLSELLVDGKIVTLISEYETTLSNSLDCYLETSCISKYSISDAMQKFVAADDKHLWIDNSLSEYVMRRSALAMMRKLFKKDEIPLIFAKFRETKR